MEVHCNEYVSALHTLPRGNIFVLTFVLPSSCNYGYRFKIGKEACTSARRVASCSSCSLHVIAANVCEYVYSPIIGAPSSWKS